MRLLQIRDDGNLTFTENFNDDQIPRYAILSHTWGKPTDEVTYQDMLDGSATAKVGFRKIKFCAEQAERDGLRYIWVDTCCIDKPNSSELQESINSMFKWYQKAQVCYAYLQDISLKGREAGSNSEDEVESRLRNSRWFTRGWTLQELIAPKEVLFYSKEWTRVGDKCSLISVICDITKIPAAGLRGAALEDFSIAERLSWQESRQTTREEDMAYALFGICGVNLPLIYSEGQENAFRRLRNEIDNISKGTQREDFAVTFAVDNVIGVDHFVARQSELREMRRELNSDGSRQTVVIHGLGGMGKTQLMVEYAKRYENDYSAVFWLNANDDGSLRASFANIAKQILRDHPTVKGFALLDSAEGNADRVVDAVRTWLSRPRNTRWLMLFDNLDNPKIPGNPDSNAVDIRKYLPSAQHGFVAITTRSSRLDIGHQIELKKLQSSAESLEILSDLAKRSFSLGDPATFQLLDKLDGLPLALATAGAYLRQSSTDLAEYLEWHDKAWAELQRTSPGLLTYQDRMLYSTWQVSFDQVERINQLSANILRLWAYFDNQDLWFELLCHDEDEMWRRGDPDKTYQRPKWIVEAVKNKLTFEAAIRVLRDHGLVQPHSREFQLTTFAGYSIHSCVHAWTRTVLNPLGATDLAILALKSVAVHALDREVDEMRWLTERRLLPHASYIAHGPWDTCLAGLAWAFTEIGRICTNQGKHNASVTLLEKAWREVEVSDVHRHERLRVARGLAFAYARQGKLDKANGMARLALHRHQTISGSSDPFALETISLLATIHVRSGELAEAKDLYLRVLQVKEDTLGSNNPSTLRTVTDCGGIYERLGELGQAEHFLERARQGLEQMYGPDHPDTVRVKYELARLAVRREEYDKAEDMFLHTIAAREGLYGPDAEQVFVACLALGRVYTRQQRWRESEKMLLRSLKGYENRHGVNGRGTLVYPIRSLGQLYQAQYRFADAEKMYIRAMRGLERALGSGDKDTAIAISQLGLLYLEQGRLQEAEETLLRALQAYETSYGPSHNERCGAPCPILP